MRHKTLNIILIPLLFCCASCVFTPRANTSFVYKLRVREQVELFVRRAQRHLENPTVRNLQHAEQSLFLAKKLDPENPQVLDGLGVITFLRGDLTRAEDLFKRAVLKAPEWEVPYIQLAVIAKMNQDYLAAKELLEMAIDKNPLSKIARLNLAALLEAHYPPEASNVKRIELEYLRAEELFPRGN